MQFLAAQVRRYSPGVSVARGALLLLLVRFLKTQHQAWQQFSLAKRSAAAESAGQKRHRLGLPDSLTQFEVRAAAAGNPLTKPGRTEAARTRLQERGLLRSQWVLPD
jgi:hypothetical protein